MEQLKVWIVSLPKKKSRALLFPVDLPSLWPKEFLCRSSHEVLTKMAAQLLEVRRRPPVALFFLFTWNIELPQTFAFKFVINTLRFSGQIFLLGNAEFTKRPLLREYTGVVNNPSSTKLSYSKWKNAVFNPSKYFLALKKWTLGFCRLLKDRSLKQWEKHRAHTLSTR